MKFFLWLGGFILFAVAYGFIEANNRGIPLTAENTPWVSIVLVPLLVLAWWLSRPKPVDHEHDPD